MLDRPSADAEAPVPMRRSRWPRRVVTGLTDNDALNIGAILAILRRRKLLLLGSILLCPLLAWLALSQITPLYTATGTLIYDQAEYKLRELQSILRADPITDAVMATQAEVLRGMPVVER